MIKKITLFIALFLLVCQSSLGLDSNEVTYHIKHIDGSRVHIIKTTASKLDVSFTTKGHKTLINCSYFNMNTRKSVPVGLYNRPFVVLKKDGSIKISDNKTDIVDERAVASGGSWLLREGKIYSTSDHFGSSFRNTVVKRTCIGVDKDNNVILVVISCANLPKSARIMKKLGCEIAINLDGGTSSTLKFQGRTMVTSKRPVVNYLVVN